jgi:hypothetical protein
MSGNNSGKGFVGQPFAGLALLQSFLEVDDRKEAYIFW